MWKNSIVLKLPEKARNYSKYPKKLETLKKEIPEKARNYSKYPKKLERRKCSKDPKKLEITQNTRKSSKVLQRH